VIDARLRKKFADAIRAGADRDYEKAAGLLADILSRSDEMPEALLYLGRARHAQGRYGQAIASFRDYLRIRPAAPAARLFLGRSYLAAGFPRKAVHFLRQAAEGKPADPDAAALLGIAYLKARSSARAVAEFERAVHLSPEDARIYRGYVNALLVRGIRLARRGDSQLSEQMLRFVVDNGGDAVLPRLELARVYREAGALEAAKLQYDRAIELAPDDLQLRWYRASILMALNDSVAAAAELELLKRNGADVPELSWNAELVDRFMIRSLLTGGQWRRAAAACSAWLKARGSDPSIHAMYAEALRESGDLDFAENHARRAIAAAPKEAGLRYELLLVLWEKEDWKGLKSELIAARQLGCDGDVVLRFTALLASRLDRDDKAVIAVVQDAIRSTGPAPELMFALASRYLRIGMPELAASWYRKTIAVQTDHEEAALGLIAASEALSSDSSDSADALTEAYSSYLERFPSNRAIEREFAMHLMKREAFERAVDILESLLAADGGNATLRRTLAYAYRKVRRYRDAIVLLKPLLKERPDQAETLLELAHCLDKAGSTAYAVKLLAEAVRYFPKASSPMLALGILLSKSGKREKALEAFREAASRAPSDPKPLRYLEETYRKSGIAEYAERYAAEAERLESKRAKLSRTPIAPH